jgi:hypothetical protein
VAEFGISGVKSEGSTAIVLVYYKRVKGEVASVLDQTIRYEGIIHCLTKHHAMKRYG